MRSSKIEIAEISALLADIWANTDVMSSKLVYAFNMATPDNEADRLQRFYQLLQHVTTRLVGAMVGSLWLHRKFGTYTHQGSRHSVGGHWTGTA